jgi:hypothetical protein
MTTPERVNNVLAKYGLLDNTVKKRIKAANAVIGLSSAYIDVEV